MITLDKIKISAGVGESPADVVFKASLVLEATDGVSNCEAAMPGFRFDSQKMEFDLKWSIIEHIYGDVWDVANKMRSALLNAKMEDAAKKELLDLIDKVSPAVAFAKT